MVRAINLCVKIFRVIVATNPAPPTKKNKNKKNNQQQQNKQTQLIFQN